MTQPIQSYFSYLKCCANVSFACLKDLDEQASNFRRKMESIAIADQENVEEGRPALAKHKMLPEVLEMLNRYSCVRHVYAMI